MEADWLRESFLSSHQVTLKIASHVPDVSSRAVRRVAHAHYDTYVIMKPDSRPDGTAIRDHARVRVLHDIHARAVQCSAGCDGDGRSYG